ncbi:MAG TPA: hypothetical protein ENJ09_01355 [Planctomycetes bacterium]|nr:hypothetical protein [Planctomycetota bacterium]
MLKLTASLALTVVFFLGTALCGGGFLEHACDCTQGNEEQCQHESECPDDPCSVSAPLAERSLAAGLQRELPPRERDFVGELVLLRVSIGTTAANPPDSSVRSMLPYAPSDRPLLS